MMLIIIIINIIVIIINVVFVFCVIELNDARCCVFVLTQIFLMIF
jgi:hypothetical protein